MLKNILSIITFVAVSVYFAFSVMPFYNKPCTVSLNTSSGEFYNTLNYSIKDHFIADGASKTYPTNFNYEKEIINYYQARVVETSVSEYAKNYYCYSSNLPNAVLVNGKKVNVHVAVTKNNITVGFPIIYYGY